MYVISISPLSIYKAARTALVVRIILNHRRSPKYTEYVVQQDRFFNHFLMCMRSDTNPLALRLESKAIGNGFQVVDIQVCHCRGMLLCIADECNIFFEKRPLSAHEKVPL